MKKALISFAVGLLCLSAYGQTDSTKTKKRELNV